MNDYKIVLDNKWTATFKYKGEFRMASEFWDLELTSPENVTISYFKNKIVLVNDFDGGCSKNCIEISKDGQFGFMHDGLQGEWVIDFKSLKIAPYRWYIHHDKDGKYLAHYEQPAYLMAREYVQMPNKLIYLTFPLTEIDQLDQVLSEYLDLRKRQLEDTYFIVG